jgi:hypothetical protein
MVEIEDKIISDELFEKKFVCDLQKCKYVSFGFKETTF